MSAAYNDKELQQRQQEIIRRDVEYSSRKYNPHKPGPTPSPSPGISVTGQRIRTYTPWSKNQCPPTKDGPRIAVPSLPLKQTMPFKDAQHSEFVLSSACIPRKLLHSPGLCKNVDGSSEKIPWVNVPGILQKDIPKEQQGKSFAEAEYQILETMPASIIQSDATSPIPGVPSYNMAIKGVSNIGPNPDTPFQTHAAFVKELNDCQETFNMCCMYFTFLSYRCPLCNQYACETDNISPETLQKLNFQMGDPPVSCKNCISNEHNVGCCTEYNTKAENPSPAKNWNPYLPGSNNPGCGKDPTLCTLKINPDGEPIISNTKYIDPLTKPNSKLLNSDGTPIQLKYPARSQNTDPAICRMGYAPEGAILGFENSNFQCDQSQASLGCPNSTVQEKCGNDNDCQYGPCKNGSCIVRPPMNIGEDPLSDHPSLLSDGSMLNSYHLAGVGVYNAMIRAARRGVKMKIIFGWPALANSYLTYISLMKIKWAALNKGKPAPDNIELIPFNMSNYFMGEINNSNDSLIHVVKDCKTGKNLPIFTLNQTQGKACKSKSDCATGNCSSKGQCYDDTITRPEFSGVTGTGIAHSGYAAVGILHNKTYVWDNKTFYVGAQNATYDASKEMGIMIRNCPALGADANRVLNSYIHAACQQEQGKTSKQFAENAKPNAALGGKKILGSNISTDINIKTPLRVKMTPRARPNGLDDRPSFTSTFKASCYLTNCPASFCEPANRTYDLEAVLCTINSAEKFCYVETYDYMEFTKFMACQQSYCLPDPYTQYSAAQESIWNNESPVTPNVDYSQYNAIDPSTGRVYQSLTSSNQKSGPQVQFLIVRDALYQAALRGVTVRMIIGQRGVQPCGDNADKIMQLRALEVATNKIVREIAKDKGVKNIGSIQFKYFTFMCSDTSRACFGAFHCKWIVTEKTCAISTSNYTGDYFAFTFGSTFVVNVPNGLDSVFPMRDDLCNIFQRDWNSSKLIEDIACQCQIMGWPFKTPKVPDMLSHYFLSTPNGGLSSAEVKSILSNTASYNTITSQEFCSKTCFQQLPGENPLPISSCFGLGSDTTIMSETLPMFSGKNAEIKNGQLVEKTSNYSESKSIPVLLVIILSLLFLISIVFFLQWKK